MRKILSFFFALFVFLPTARGAEMVNVEYIHQYLNARWGIELPYNPALENPKVAANMEYLLTVVDIANEYLNGEKITSYGTGEYATKLAADTIATNTAIDTLVRGPFTMTTTPDTTSYSMTIGAAGTFVIDWGDGEIETIRNKPLGNVVYSHTYDAPGEYDITLGGRATDYAIIDLDASEIPTVSFFWADLMGGEPPTNLAKISGRLGRVFPTLENGKNPNFAVAFSFAPITEIPAELFDGVHGAPVVGMFASTFQETPITNIPADLFAGMSGAPALGMFADTFSDTQITSIPENLFAGISGAPAEYMFRGTFSSTQITSIPENLFAGISGAPAEYMFQSTFRYTPITSIPANLFGELNGNGAPSMFASTFYGCDQLQTVEGPLFSGTITPAERMFDSTFYSSGLTSIPANLFAGVQGSPAEYMFFYTFENTPITSVPANLFGELNGDGAANMFYMTFAECDQLQTVEGPLFSGTITPAERMFDSTFYSSGLTSIPADLFAGISGAPAVEMFASTFDNCDSLQSIPDNLFAGISGPAADDMFSFTFSGCSALTGPSARIDGQYLYEIWPDVDYQGTYFRATGLSDYDQIPSDWR